MPHYNALYNAQLSLSEAKAKFFSQLYFYFMYGVKISLTLVLISL